jgi:preprotein translocase subunit YajC
MKFKVGDIVTIIKPPKVRGLSGKLGKVVRVSSQLIRVEIENHGQVEMYRDEIKKIIKLEKAMK